MTRQAFYHRRYIEELAVRSEPGTFGFGFTAIIIILISFYIEPWKQIGIPIALAILVVNTVRYLVSRRCTEKKMPGATFMRIALPLICLNAMLWNVLFFSAYAHDQMLGVASIISLLMTSGFSTGATVSLSASRLAMFSFQGLLVGPLFLRLIYLGCETGSKDYWTMATTCTAFFFFNFKATQNYRKDLVNFFNREYDLEEMKQRLSAEQDKLIHSSRLASLGEMAGGLAHEINNPLAILMLGLDAIETPPGKVDREEYRMTKMKTMRKAVERISKIIKGLRHFSQQGDTLPVESVSVKSIIDETLEFFLGRMRSADISHLVTGDIDAHVQVRPVQVSQVLLNLLTNALDAVKSSGHKNVTIEVVAEPKWVMIDVSDTGPGLDPAIRERLFQPFATSKAPGQGMGLGLSISRGIMREHGGDLILLFDRTKTTFRIILPAT